MQVDHVPPEDLFGDGQEWHLAFRGTPYIGKQAYEAYVHGSENVADGCKQIRDTSLPCKDHYRSSILDKWRDIDEVAFVVVKDGVIQRYAIFYGHGTTNMNWFNENKVKTSNWKDLTGQPNNVFGIFGDDYFERHFYISHNYDGCDNDAGWFVSADDSDPACDWEKGEMFPVFIYADSDSYQNFDSGKVSKADAIAVYVKYRVVEFLDFVDIFGNEEEWRLVFRGTSHINQSVYNAYVHGSQNVDEGCQQLNGDFPCKSHYRSAILDTWSDIDEVVLAVYKSGQMQQYLRFDGKGTNNVNWFSEDKLLDSSWSGIKGHNNVFSIKGDEDLDRRFMVNHNYGGCESDAGWLIAVDKHEKPCGWESVKTYPLFLFSKSTHSENWTKGQVSEADVIAVFVKFASQGLVIG